MSHTVSNRRANLAAGVALLGCTLAAADRAHAQNMVYTTVTSITLSGTANSFTLPNTNWSGSANYLDGSETYSQMSIPNGYITSYALAYRGSSYDVIFFDISSGFIMNWTLSGSFGITLSQSVTVTLYNATSWLINGSALSDGQTIAAGNHIIDWTYDSTSSGTASYLPIVMEFAQASGGAVPLPGAAGLAACGLRGLSRRRRR